VNPEEQVESASVQTEEVQGVSQDVGEVSQDTNSQQSIDYEKAYKNLEKDYTRKSQKLKELEDWGKFAERTGLTAEQALQAVDQYDNPEYGQFPPQQQLGMQQQPQPGIPDQWYSQQADPNQYAQQPNWGQPGVYNPPTQTDPRVSQLEQELTQLKRGQQIAQLRQKFPQFDEYYSEVVNLADQQGLDLETAFGRVAVDHWDDFVGKTKEQVVQNIRQKGDKQLESTQTTQGADDAISQLSQEEIEAAKAMGISPQDYAQAKQSMSID
jgi:hypothetical protein